jgi:hypothetical protein
MVRLGIGCENGSMRRQMWAVVVVMGFGVENCSRDFGVEKKFKEFEVVVVMYCGIVDCNGDFGLLRRNSKNLRLLL